MSGGRIVADQKSMDLVADESLDVVLATLAGPQATPRADQRTAVRALMAPGARVLVVQATGWGKSAVYWAATAALRGMGRGPTIVVSPLLALMRDQVAAANAAGLTAGSINSSNFEEWEAVLVELEREALDVLLVSPERLANPRFMQRIGPLLERSGLIVIDEAHCISDWGFDFRPDYQRLSKLLTTSTDVPVLATTATANVRVSEDVAAQLGSDTLVLRGSLARSSLRLSVVDGLSALERYAWVHEALGELGGSGIIYVPTVADTSRLAAFLAAQGHVVAAYSGQLDPEVRFTVEHDLRENRLKAVVATSALGMGYDKPDLGFCIHVGSPDSPVAYYQQVGRAGRAIDRAEAVLLPAETDERLWEYFATASMPVPSTIAAVLHALEESASSLTVPALEAATGVRRGRLDATLKILAVEGSVERISEGWRTTGIPYAFDEAKWTDIRAVRAQEASLMRSYARGNGCLMEFLQTALDDPDPGPCGSCSVCTSRLPSPGRAPGSESVAAATQFLRGRDTIIEPRKMWPSGIEDLKGRILGAAEGRALTFADDPGWRDAAREVAGADVSLTDEVVGGLVDVLARWRVSWPERPVAIVPMPSHRHSLMIGDLAARLGAIGSLPVLQLLAARGGAPQAQAASGSRVSVLRQRLSLIPGCEIPNGPLLVVDDIYRTGWTMTVAANLLRSAGARSVMPLVVHQQP